MTSASVACPQNWSPDVGTVEQLALEIGVLGVTGMYPGAYTADPGVFASGVMIVDAVASVYFAGVEACD